MSKYNVGKFEIVITSNYGWYGYKIIDKKDGEGIFKIVMVSESEEECVMHAVRMLNWLLEK